MRATTAHAGAMTFAHPLRVPGLNSVAVSRVADRVWTLSEETALQKGSIGNYVQSSKVSSVGKTKRQTRSYSVKTISILSVFSISLAHHEMFV